MLIRNLNVSSRTKAVANPRLPVVVENNQWTTHAPGITGNVYHAVMYIGANTNEFADAADATQLPELLY